jgi:hypothetical protein
MSMRKISRRGLLKLACAAVAAGAGIRAPAQPASPRFRDADRTRERIVAVVRAFEPGYARPLPGVQEIKPLTDIDLPGIKVQPDQVPLVDYFVGDLQLRYSFDDPRYISSVSASDLKRLKLRREDLLPLAIANFRRRYAKFKVERMQGFLASVTNAGELEPSLMLDTGFWDLERQRAGGDIVAGAPARDSLVFTARTVAWHVDALRRLVTDVHASAGNDALSRKLYLWSQGRWEVFA